MTDTQQKPPPPPTYAPPPTNAPPPPTNPIPPYGYPLPPLYPYPYQPRPKKTYPVDAADTILALALVVMGYLAWDWVWPKETPSGLVHLPGISFTVYVCLALTFSMVYFRYRRVHLTKPAMIAAMAIVLTALPFTVYDTTPVHYFAAFFLVISYFTWHAYAARTAISPQLGAATAIDVINQTIVVPFSNLGSWFSAVKGLPRGKKTMGQILFAIVGVAVALPVIGIVVALLTQSDTSFDSWMSQVRTYILDFNLWGFLWKFVLGIPVAIYLFALLYGNARRMGTESITHESVTRMTQSMRKITTVALTAPTAVLCAIYVVFFFAMGSHLFAAFFGRLPMESTYADFAREGFFQLTTVAGINLAVLGFTYLFAKRLSGTAIPRSLRVLGAVLSALTILLVVTAMSKMILYVSQYGLTRLRVYTLWFMALLFVVFALVGVWYIRRFRVDIPLITVAMVSFIVLAWANTDGMIADYNVDHYLRGDMDQIDISYLADDLSDAAVPSLVKLSQEGPDATVRTEAYSAVLSHLTRDDSTSWTSWNWQSYYGKLLGK